MLGFGPEYKRERRDGSANHRIHGGVVYFTTRPTEIVSDLTNHVLVKVRQTTYNHNNFVFYLQGSSVWDIYLIGVPEETLCLRYC